MAAMISSRGRYALRVMSELAEQGSEQAVPLKEIAAHQGLSQKYLEAIMTTLSKGGLVEGQHGKGGGYRLCRRPEDDSLGEILRLTEGSLAPVACLEAGNSPCEHPCPTLPVWEKLEQIVADYLNNVSLADLLPKG